MMASLVPKFNSKQRRYLARGGAQSGQTGDSLVRRFLSAISPTHDLTPSGAYKTTETSKRVEDHMVTIKHTVSKGSQSGQKIYTVVTIRDIQFESVDQVGIFLEKTLKASQKKEKNDVFVYYNTSQFVQLSYSKTASKFEILSHGTLSQGTS